MEWVVVAAYNEEQKIGQVVSDLKAHGHKNIVVVNDGSDDATAKIAKAQKAHVLSHLINRGQGAALKTGIDYALRQGAKTIITFDGDGQHLASDIPKLVKPIKEGRVHVVLGSRFLKGSKSNVPAHKKVLLKGGRTIIRAMYGIKTTDSHNGLRAISRQAAQRMQLKADGMEHASEILEEIAKRRITFTEVPVNIRYTEYSKAHGQSPFNAVNILFKMVMKKLMR